MKKLFYISLFQFIVMSIAWAQPHNNNSPAALSKSGDEEIEKGQYYNALDQYTKAYGEVKDKDIAIKIAKTHFLLRDYTKAVNWFNRVLSKDKANKYLEERFLYGRALKMAGSTTEAAAEFKTYIETGADPNLKAWAETELKGIELMGTLKENVALNVKNIGSPVNNPENQSSPAIDVDGTLYFGSLGVKDSKDKDKNDDGVHFCNLYSSTKVPEKGYGKATALPENINREGYHTANVSISPDGNTMYYTRVVSDGGYMEESKLYASAKTAGGWSPALEVTGINGDYIVRHPVEGELYGNRVLFFAANIPGGKGGFDLYYANKTGEASFSEPIGLGSLNTAMDELTPYYVDGKLYFSSEGWPGLGGLDVFSSTWNGSEFSTPINLGMPINSSVDDIYYKINKNGDMGFLVSNRDAPGSKSLKGKTCCDDIYTVEKRKFILELSNIIKDQSKKAIKGATVQLIEMSGGKDGEIQSKTNNDGNIISFLLDKDKSYKVVVSKASYFPEEIQLNTVGVTEDQEYKREFILKNLPPESDVEILTINEAIRLNNIYYNYDDDKILKDAEGDLYAIMDLMTKYPDMTIELGSHTDSRGDDNYNQKLSLRRANSARRWLMNKGVAGDRITAKGYGETVILNNCTNGEDCTDEEHRYNRRTEFKILSGPTTIEVKKEVLKKKGNINKG